MIRYERTGEFRSPAIGEWHEREGEPTKAGMVFSACWILRRIEEPEADKPKPRTTKELVDGLEVRLEQVRSYGNLQAVVNLTEIIRRVKVHDELLKRSQLPIGLIARDELAEILEGDG